GVTRVYLAVNHFSEQIVKTLGDGSRLGVEIEYSHEKKPLSTIGPLRLIQNLPENFIVANSDILTDLDFKILYDTHLKNNAKITVATHTRKIPIEFGVLSVDDKGMVTSFQEKPELNLAVSMGIYVFNKSILNLVPNDQPFGFDELVFELIDKKVPIHTFPYSGYWLDIGRPDDYQRANDEADRFEDSKD
ncbi:MAG TPA: sugar phosphate nucleotidyltransferase, partial [candidate division Zixibacteria bacterium]|nr:sugar phosphate nucleotidyltransferase [candidate division Zixibacteria bacterium]